MHPSLRKLDHRPWPLPSGPWRWRQRWIDLLFAHWPVPASRLRHLVPSGVRIEEFDGTSWVGVVPFRMEGVMLRPLPDFPAISAFPELNLRLYVEAEGKPGVWFLSLDAGNSLAVWAARRFFHLPYFRADMTVRGDGERIRYESVRRASDARVAFAGRYAPAGEVFESRRGSIEHFLTERYCLYTQTRDGRIVRAQVHHPPWPLQEARAEIDENSIGRPHGLGLAEQPALVHFSKRLDVVVWPPENVSG